MVEATKLVEMKGSFSVKEEKIMTKEITRHGARDVAQLVECLHDRHKPLNSITNT